MAHTNHNYSISNTPNHPSHPNSADIKQYYIKLINDEFRNLQLDSDLKSKSLFDLIDYCELLYEKSSRSENNKQRIQYYVKGYLIFNYFINSFIMVHFKGFDSFIESNEQDFIIYLNVFAFYVNNSSIVQNDSYSIPIETLRNWVLAYLVEKNLLSFNVDDLYNWLYEYIEYLKTKDRVVPEEEEDLAQEDLAKKQEPFRSGLAKSKKSYNLKLTIGDHTSNDTVYSMQNSSFNDNSDSAFDSDYDGKDPLNKFKNRYPVIKIIDGDIPKDNYVDRNTDDDNAYLSHEVLPPNSSTSSVNTGPLKSPPPPPPMSPPPPPPEHSWPRISLIAPYPVGQPNFLNDFKQTPYPLTISSEKLYFNDHENSDSNRGTLRANNTYVDNGYSEAAITSNSSTYNRPPQTVPIQKTPLVAVPTHVHANGFVPYNNVSNSSNSFNNDNKIIFHQPPNKHSNQHSNYYPSTSQSLVFQQHHHHYYAQSQPRPHTSIIPQPVKQQHNQIKNQKFHYMKEYSVCGLKNFGSSCYINSTIQLLFGLYKFNTIFENSEYQKYIKDPKFVNLIKSSKTSKVSMLLSEAIAGLLKVFKDHGSASIAPTKFLRIASLLKPDFNIPYEQQDAQEFLLFVLERLHEELAYKIPSHIEISNQTLEEYILKWNININIKDKDEYLKWYMSLVKSEGNSPIHDLFQGHLQNKLICYKCNYESINYSPFTILSLPIPNTHGGNVDLSDCLKYYTKDEILSGENAWNCPKCSKNKSNEPVASVLDTHPVFNNKKSGLFKFSRRSKSPTKEKNKAVTTLNSMVQNDSISIKTLDFIKLPQILFIHLSRFSMYNLTDKLDTVIQYPLELKFNNHNHNINYKLTGLINHYGNLKSGHYTSLVNKSNLNQNRNSLDNIKHPYWCLFDDDNVRVNLSHGNINQPNYNEHNSRDVYVLCYERI